jgi:hypothetical protein
MVPNATVVACRSTNFGDDKTDLAALRRIASSLSNNDGVSARLIDNGGTQCTSIVLVPDYLTNSEARESEL